MPIFCRKNVHSFRNTALMSRFSKFSSKTPCCHAHIWSKTSILSKLHYIMSQKSQYDALFFPISQGKIIAFMPIFCKKRPFSKKHAALKSRFCQKNGHSVKNTVLLCHFFKFFMTNPLLSTPYLVKKTLILSKWHYDIGRKRQYPFFPDFSLKSNNFHAHILSEKYPLSKNTLLSCPYFVRKTSIL